MEDSVRIEVHFIGPTDWKAYVECAVVAYQVNQVANAVTMSRHVDRIGVPSQTKVLDSVEAGEGIRLADAL